MEGDTKSQLEGYMFQLEVNKFRNSTLYFRHARVYTHTHKLHVMLYLIQKQYIARFISGAALKLPPMESNDSKLVCLARPNTPPISSSESPSPRMVSLPSARCHLGINGTRRSVLPARLRPSQRGGSVFRCVLPGENVLHHLEHICIIIVITKKFNYLQLQYHGTVSSVLQILHGIV